MTYAAGWAAIALFGLCLGERVAPRKVLAFVAIVAGVVPMTLFENGVTGSVSGILLALIGGCGSALFIFLAKWFRIGSGLPQLVWLFGFGSVFLLIPLVYEGVTIPSGFTWVTLFALDLLPTIGGLYFTTRAVEGGQASKVKSSRPAIRYLRQRSALRSLATG